jgi:hypothetical protein
VSILEKTIGGIFAAIIIYLLLANQNTDSVINSLGQNSIGLIKTLQAR